MDHGEHNHRRGRRLRRAVRLCISITLLLCAVVSTLWFSIGRQGSSDLEQWIGGYLVNVVENYINPTVSFKTLDYQAPRTLVLHDLMLTAKRTPILRVQTARLELARVPQRGQPVRIHQIDLDGLDLKFIQQHERGIVGWGNFVKREVVRGSQTVSEGQRFSDILELRQVNIRNGRIEYDKGSDTHAPMVLSGVTLALSSKPSADQPGVYQLHGSCQRESLVDIEWDSHINLDTGVWDIQTARLLADINDQQYASMPAQLQEVLKRYDIQGDLEVGWQGQIPLLDLPRTAGNLHVLLNQGHLQYEGLRCPVDALDVRLSLPDRKVQLTANNLNMRSPTDLRSV